jgi:hypothetical protein
MPTSRRLNRIRGIVIPAVIATFVVAVGSSGPAAADPPGLVKVGATSASTSFDKNLTALCPAGKVVTGGGGYLTAPAAPNQGRVALDRLEPLNNGSGFVAGMREVGPNINTWQLSTDALCVTEPPGWDVVSNTGPMNTQVVGVNCGTKNVIGVGGRINSGNGEVILDYIVPSADLKSVTVRGTVVDGESHTGWSVTAFAVCAYVDDLELLEPFVPSSSSAHKGLSASCPSGMGLYSIGAAISPGSGEMFLTLVHAITTHTFSVAADEDISGYPLNWVLFGYAICGG